MSSTNVITVLLLTLPGIFVERGQCLSCKGTDCCEDSEVKLKGHQAGLFASLMGLWEVSVYKSGAQMLCCLFPDGRSVQSL